MSRRFYLFAAIAVLLAALFVRLGFWQLSRFQERRAVNAESIRPLALPEVPFDSVAGLARYRRVTLEGTPDHSHEFTLGGRSRNGVPGVYVFTPYRLHGRDTAVVVNRGWVYAPDAATADLGRYRERGGAVRGFTDTLPLGPPQSPADASAGRGLRRLTYGGVTGMVPYPVHRLYVVMRDSAGADTPARLAPPRGGSGPHLGYAVQWFSFAIIALVGTAIAMKRARRDSGAGAARKSDPAGLDLS